MRPNDAAALNERIDGFLALDAAIARELRFLYARRKAGAILLSDDYIDGLEKEIIALKAILEPLESGQIRVGGPDETLGRTQARIADLKWKIAQAQSILERHYAHRT